MTDTGKKLVKKILFSLGIATLCASSTAFAKSVECERYSTSGEENLASDYDKLFKKRIIIDVNKFKSLSGRKALEAKIKRTETLDGVKINPLTYTLIPNGKMLVTGDSRVMGGAFYKCNMKPRDVLAAQK